MSDTPQYDQITMTNQPTIREQIDMVNAMAEAAIVAERIDPESAKSCAAALAKLCIILVTPFVTIKAAKTE